MKMKRWIRCIPVLCCLWVLFLAGCGQEAAQETENAYQIYMMNLTGTGLTPVSYVPQETGGMALAEELVRQMREMQDQDRYAPVLPDNIQIDRMDLSATGELTLQFSEDYAELSGYNEILIRAGVVRTLIQVPEVSTIVFYVGEETLTDADDAIIGSMTSETFIDYVGDDTEAMREMTLTLYYASADGQHLVRLYRDIYYNANVAPERLVIEYLKERPSDEDAQVPLPASTRVLNIAVTDHICYVDLDSSFLTAMDGVSQQISVYAIVNSLTELKGIEGVQITIEGASEDLMVAGQQLSAIYTKDLSLVVIPQDYNTNVLSEVPSVEGTEASGTEEDAEGNAAGEPGQEGTPQE